MVRSHGTEPRILIGPETFGNRYKKEKLRQVQKYFAVIVALFVFVISVMFNLMSQHDSGFHDAEG